jgi:hypothetical protein
MANRKNGAVALARSEFPEESAEEAPVAPAPKLAHSTTGTYSPIESTFFTKGDLGIVEPPVYLPKDPILLPLVGVFFLAGLTALCLL